MVKLSLPAWRLGLTSETELRPCKRLQLRTPPEATPIALLRQATSAARINDARVLTTASGREKSIHQWEELRMFDPGD